MSAQRVKYQRMEAALKDVTFNILGKMSEREALEEEIKALGEERATLSLERGAESALEGVMLKIVGKLRERAALEKERAALEEDRKALSRERDFHEKELNRLTWESCSTPLPREVD